MMVISPRKLRVRADDGGDLQACDDSGITAKDLGLDEPQARQYYLVQELMERFANTVLAEPSDE